jgi:hypothetical protein
MARSRPACSDRSRSASPLATPRRAMTMAVFTLPSAAYMALRAADRSTPAASMTMR